MADHKARTTHEHHSRADHLLHGAGYESKAADRRSDEKMIRKAIDEHDDQLHGGKKTHLKFARGGSVPGHSKGKRGPKVMINIHTGAGQMEKQAALRAGIGIGARAGARMASAKMAGPPGGAMPGGAAPPMAPGGVGGPANPMVRPGMMAKGGAVKYGDGDMEGGAGSGVGRIDKADTYGVGERVKVKGHWRRHPSSWADNKK
ncbi:MAG: hypothetical protein KGL39_03740 [Patescibacteria group bacterium]|nr:hypothetical protein [Patescibacteria group bacterium]